MGSTSTYNNGKSRCFTQLLTLKKDGWADRKSMLKAKREVLSTIMAEMKDLYFQGRKKNKGFQVKEGNPFLQELDKKGYFIMKGLFPDKKDGKIFLPFL